MSKECPVCGCNAEDLKDEYQPMVVGRFGKVLKMKCRICGEYYIDRDSPLENTA